jgi:hypothetical protein
VCTANHDAPTVKTPATAASMAPLPECDPATTTQPTPPTLAMLADRMTTGFVLKPSGNVTF